VHFRLLPRDSPCLDALRGKPKIAPWRAPLRSAALPGSTALALVPAWCAAGASSGFVCHGVGHLSDIPSSKAPTEQDDTFMCEPGANAWSDDEPGKGDAMEDTEPTEVPPPTDDEIRDIAEKVLKNFRNVTVDWRTELPEAELPPPPTKLDIFKHIMHINPGKIYQRLEKEDTNGDKYGYIPKMAQGSKGCIGFLPAASFCERVNSVAKDVMTDAHVLMGEKSLDKLVVLRINRGLMQYMRLKYNGLTQQQFGQTVVELVEEKEKAKEQREDSSE